MEPVSHESLVGTGDSTGFESAATGAAGGFESAAAGAAGCCAACSWASMGATKTTMSSPLISVDSGPRSFRGSSDGTPCSSGSAVSANRETPGHDAQDAADFDCRQTCMTLQTQQPHLLPDEHARVGRSVGLVTGCTAFKTHRRVLKRERAALISMTLETTGLIGGENLQHGGPDASVGIVAIDAAHHALGQSVMKRLLELCPG